MKQAVLVLLILLTACTQTTPSEYNQPEANMIVMKLSSPAFKDGESIPSKHTCDGENSIVPLRISGVPKNTLSISLVVDDPDAPVGIWNHWILWNIPPETKEINNEIKVPHGKNSWGKLSYGGPCPPDKEHIYQF
ncbi:YbhB/YbcL family Raf kinase inhibitor-like protein, partial [archaeon]|nr:YbhB/YbcL family Raf kinase inhibitor-like protein [archaeon]